MRSRACAGGNQAASAILRTHEGATLGGLGKGIHRLLKPARRLYKSSPGLARWINRTIWTLAGPAKRGETRAMIRLLEQAGPYTLIGAWGLLALYRLCREADSRKIPGAFVECGVYRGGCGGVMAALAARSPLSRRTWLFDSFEGLPDPTPEDASTRWATPGRYAAPIDDVHKLLFEDLALDPSGVSLEKGWFDATLPEASPKIGPIAVLRLDADLYASTRCCFENLYEQVTPGGFVIVDDYHGWPGCRKAVDEYLAAQGVQVEMHRIDPFDRARRISAVWFEKP